MKGETKMTLTYASVLEALEQYVDRQMKETVTVKGWEIDRNTTHQTGPAVNIVVEEVDAKPLESSRPFVTAEPFRGCEVAAAPWKEGP